MWWLLSDDDPGFVLSAAATSPPTSTLPLTPGDMPPTLAPDPLPASVPAASSGHTPGSSVTVHVAGAVATPGVVVVHGGSRVIEAVAAAGGLTGAADADSVNLARQVLDGELVVVPTPGQVLSAPVAPGAAGGGGIAGDGGGDAAGGATGLVDINRADASRLDGLPGIGPVLAERIISYREDTGPFAHIEDLRSVPGIGDKVFGGIRDLVVV